MVGTGIGGSVGVGVAFDGDRDGSAGVRVGDTWATEPEGDANATDGDGTDGRVGCGAGARAPTSPMVAIDVARATSPLVPIRRSAMAVLPRSSACLSLTTTGIEFGACVQNPSWPRIGADGHRTSAERRRTKGPMSQRRRRPKLAACVRVSGSGCRSESWSLGLCVGRHRCMPTPRRAHGRRPPHASWTGAPSRDGRSRRARRCPARRGVRSFPARTCGTCGSTSDPSRRTRRR